MWLPSVRETKGSDSFTWLGAQPLAQRQPAQPSRPPHTEQFLTRGWPTSGKSASKGGYATAPSPRSPKIGSSPNSNDPIAGPGDAVTALSEAASAPSICMAASPRRSMYIR